MLVPIRNMLVLGALCWVAPLSAQSHVTVSLESKEAGCPYKSAGLPVVVAGTSAEASHAALPVFDVGRRAPGLLP